MSVFMASRRTIHISTYQPIYVVDPSTKTLWTGLFPIAGCLVLLLLYFIEIPVFNTNNVDLDQTPRSVVSDLGLHSLPRTLLNWVNVKNHPEPSAHFS